MIDAKEGQIEPEEKEKSVVYEQIGKETIHSLVENVESDSDDNATTWLPTHYC